jgi:hypothetical protein
MISHLNITQSLLLTNKCDSCNWCYYFNAVFITRQYIKFCKEGIKLFVNAVVLFFKFLNIHYLMRLFCGYGVRIFQSRCCSVETRNTASKEIFRKM